MNSMNQVEFYSMDKTKGHDDFFTHTLAHQDDAATYTFTHKSFGQLQQQRIMTVSATSISYEVSNFNCNDVKSEGMLYEIFLDEAGAIADYSVKTYRPQSRQFSGSLPKDEMKDVSIPAGKCVIDNFGGMLNDMQQNEKEMFALLNNGQNIPMQALVRTAARSLSHAA